MLDSFKNTINNIHKTGKIIMLLGINLSILLLLIALITLLGNHLADYNTVTDNISITKTAIVVLAETIFGGLFIDIITKKGIS